MEVKIKQGNEMIEATIEMVDGVMIVTPKEDRFDITKFKDGDVITCGSECDGGLSWIFILKGEMENFHDDYKFAEEYVSLDSNGSFEVGSYSDAIKWFRPAIECEKQELFDKLKEEGYEFDFEKKKLIKLKWKPMEGEPYFSPIFSNIGFLFSTCSHIYTGHFTDEMTIKKMRAFRTKDECQLFCDKLNQTIEEYES